jgi:glycosyltransferase involved in cell wall biosynthesis
MKVLHIIANVDTREGGPIEALRLSAEAMNEMGHQAEVVSLDDPASPWVSAFPFPVNACGPAQLNGRFAYNLAPWIRQNARRFDVAIIHGLWNWASIGGWLGLRQSGLPYVIFTHGMMDPWFKRQYPLKDAIKQITWTVAQGKVLRDASAVLFTCEVERKLAAGSFIGYSYSSKVVPLGIAEPPKHTADQTAEFRRHVPKLEGRPYLLFLSRIHLKKGCDLLLDAFAKLQLEYPQIDVVIAGPDQAGLQAVLMDTALQAGIADRLHWPGMLTGDAKWGAFRGAEAFVLPSHQENFGIVVAEAMACGTPVLISDKVNIWKEVEASGGGLVRSDTVEDVEALLRSWLTMPMTGKYNMRQAAQDGFRKYFHIDAAARELLAVLQSVGRAGPQSVLDAD